VQFTPALKCIVRAIKEDTNKRERVFKELGITLPDNQARAPPEPDLVEVAAPVRPIEVVESIKPEAPLRIEKRPRVRRQKKPVEV